MLLAGGGRRTLLGLAATVVLAGAAAGVFGAAAASGSAPPEPAPAPSTPASTLPAPATSKDARPAPLATPVRPVAIDVPGTDIHADQLVPLGLAADGTLEVPRDPATPGWYTRGPWPGQYGPAVIAGHVDSRSGPGVFWDLGELGPGQPVDVALADDRVARYTVDRVEQVPKGDFPTRAVYGPTDGATLRLITCGGSFDHASGHYRDNVIVFARLTALGPVS